MQKIKYSEITEVEVSTEMLNERIRDIEAGDYTNGYAVINYKNDKKVYIPVEDLNGFISSLKGNLK